MICFVGAHYKIYCRNRDEGDSKQFHLGGGYWKCYNDEKKEFYKKWIDVVNSCIETIAVPTLLFYEQVDGPYDQYYRYRDPEERAYVHLNDIIEQEQQIIVLE